MNIPTLSKTRTMRTIEERRHRIAQRRVMVQVKAAAAIVEEAYRLPSVVNYMKTIQADRRDAQLMLQYVRGKAREDAKQANQTQEN